MRLFGSRFYFKKNDVKVNQKKIKALLNDSLTKLGDKWGITG